MDVVALLRAAHTFSYGLVYNPKRAVDIVKTITEGGNLGDYSYHAIRQLPATGYHDSLNYTKNGMFERLANQYANSSVYKYFKLTFEDWMDLPQHRRDSLVKIADKKISELANAIKNTGNGKGVSNGVTLGLEDLDE